MQETVPLHRIEASMMTSLEIDNATTFSSVSEMSHRTDKPPGSPTVPRVCYPRYITRVDVGK